MPTVTRTGRRWADVSILAAAFPPFFRDGTEAEKDKARETLFMRFGTLSEQLGHNSFMIGDRMTIADCYLFVMLSWAAVTHVPVPALLDEYLTRMKCMPSMAKVLVPEGLA
jgi:glutathione S-transferase